MTEPAIAELADQVRAWLAADEATIRAALAALRFGVTDEVTGSYLAFGNPARVLAEVGSKRALLDLALGWEHHSSDNYYETCPGGLNDDERPCRCGRDERVLAVLQHLAQPYSD